MKKLAILLTVFAVFALAGCGSDESKQPSVPAAPPAQKVEQPKQLIKTDPKEQPGYVEMKGNGRKMGHF